MAAKPAEDLSVWEEEEEVKDEKSGLTFKPVIEVLPQTKRTEELQRIFLIGPLFRSPNVSDNGSLSIF